MTPRQWLPLIGITLCVFIFNMSEFMPIGLLTDIAKDFDVSEAKAGLLISVYAWAVAILSLPLMLALRKVQYRPMLLVFVALFAFFQLLSGISSGYWMLMFSRLGVAVAHSVFWSIAAPLAVSVVPKEYSKLALSLIATGTSLAMVLGLPVGRTIGLAMGWRMTFVVIGIVAILALVLLIAVFPKVRNPGTFTLKRMPDIYRNRCLMGIYLVLAVFVTGYYLAYSYIEPFLGSAGMSETMITLGMTVFGVAGIAGSLLFSKLYRKLGIRYLQTFIFIESVCLLLLYPSSFSWIAVMAVMAVWGLSILSFNVSLQNEALRSSPSDGSAIAMALFSGIYNVGIAMGSLLGGFVTDAGMTDSIGFIGGAVCLCAGLFTAIWLVKRFAEREKRIAELIDAAEQRRQIYQLNTCSHVQVIR